MPAFWLLLKRGEFLLQLNNLPMSKPLILALCTGNSCRSHMAEGMLRAAHNSFICAGSSTVLSISSVIVWLALQRRAFGALPEEQKAGFEAGRGLFGAKAEAHALRGKST